MLTQAEEVSFIARANDDDDGRAFDQLYNHYFSRVYNYVHYRVADLQSAEDITSQIFEKLFARREFYQSEKATFSAWLFCIARNTITDYYRSSRVRTQFTSLEITAELVDDGESDPCDRVIFNETQQHLLKALDLLTQRERDIIALKFWGGSSNRDIARLVGLSESNTAVILFRAMRQLRLILESQRLNIYG